MPKHRNSTTYRQACQNALTFRIPDMVSKNCPTVKYRVKKRYDKSVCLCFEILQHFMQKWFWTAIAYSWALCLMVPQTPNFEEIICSKYFSSGVPKAACGGKGITIGSNVSNLRSNDRFRTINHDSLQKSQKGFNNKFSAKHKPKPAMFWPWSIKSTGRGQQNVWV